jgi:hypothetical protein
MAFRCAAFHDATTERELFQIFGASLAEFGCEVYVIVDFALLGKTTDTSKAFSWVQAFCAIFRNLCCQDCHGQLWLAAVPHHRSRVFARRGPSKIAGLDGAIKEDG